MRYTTSLPRLCNVGIYNEPHNAGMVSRWLACSTPDKTACSTFQELQTKESNVYKHIQAVSEHFLLLTTLLLKVWEYDQLHTHNTHTHRRIKRCNHHSSWGCDPCPLLQGTLGLALDKLLKPGQALTGALTMPLHCGVNTWSPTCTSAELGTVLFLPQPKPGPQFTILLGPGLGAKWRKTDVPFLLLLLFAFCLSSINWWDLNLWSSSWQSSALTTWPHIHTHTHTMWS